jgi:hypothetical protein
MSTLSLLPDRPEEGIGSHYRWLWAIMWLVVGNWTQDLRKSRQCCWAISPTHRQKILINISSKRRYSDQNSHEKIQDHKSYRNPNKSLNEMQPYWFAEWLYKLAIPPAIEECSSFSTGPLVLQTLYAPVQGNARAKKGEWVGRGVGGWYGDFWYSIGNVNELNT